MPPSQVPVGGGFSLGVGGKQRGTIRFACFHGVEQYRILVGGVRLPTSVVRAPAVTGWGESIGANLVFG